MRRRTFMHGTAAGFKDAFHGLKEGSEVAVRVTGSGTKKTAVEVDNLGKDGLKAVEVTVSKVDVDGAEVKSADAPSPPGEPPPPTRGYTISCLTIKSHAGKLL